MNVMAKMRENIVGKRVSGAGEPIKVYDTGRMENLDFMRLMSIYFVVCIHYVGWGGIANASGVTMANFALSGGIAVTCNCAVNCFYMITGYFCDVGGVHRT